MSFLDDIESSSETVVSPPYIVLYGQAGCGKSWLCRFLPKPHYIALEHGVDRVPNIGRFTHVNKNSVREIKIPKNADEFFQALGYFCTAKHDYKTVVIDSATFLERLFIADIIAKNPTETIKKKEVKVSSISDYNFGRGYEKLNGYWNRFHAAVDILKSMGIGVTVICHATKRTVSTLGGDDYKKDTIGLSKFGQCDTGALIYAKADHCLFMQSEVMTKTTKNNFGSEKTIAIQGTNPDIVVYTRSQSGFDAKVRTETRANIQDYYLIDIDDDNTSKKLFNDLVK